MKSGKGDKKMENKLIFNNTYKTGRATVLVLKEKDKYVGICLEFDLEVAGSTHEEAKERIVEYMQVWHKNIVENKLPETLLNRPAPKKYWNMLEKVTKDLEAQREAIEEGKTVKEKILSPIYQSSSAYNSLGICYA